MQRRWRLIVIIAAALVAWIAMAECQEFDVSSLPPEVREALELDDQHTEEDPRAVAAVRVAFEGDVDALKRLVAEGAGADVLSTLLLANGDTVITTPILAAARAGQVDVLRYLVEETEIDVDAIPKISRPPRGSGFTALALAVLGNHAAAVDYLVDQGANPSPALRFGHTALDIALENPSMVARLVAAGADVNHEDRFGVTPLQRALRNVRFADTAGVLLELGANPNQADEKGVTPLHHAVGTKSEWVIPLLNQGARWDVVDNRQNAVLHSIGRKTQLDVVTQLLDLGHPLDPVNVNGSSPLFSAIHTGNVEVARELLRRGADLKRVTRFGESALHVAARGLGPADLIPLVLAGGVPLEWKDFRGRTALFSSAESARFESTQLLTDSGSDLDTRNQDGLTPLHAAFSSGLESWPDHLWREQGGDPTGARERRWFVELNPRLTVEALLAGGADPNQGDFDGRSPLFTALPILSAELLDWMVRSGADIEARDLAGRTPLMEATEKGLADAVEVLLHAGSDANAADIKGSTSLHYVGKPHSAIRRESGLDITDMLVGACADLDARDRNGATPLAIASEHRRLAIASRLLESGASPSVADIKGITALHWASSRGLLELATRLLDAGADVEDRTAKGETALHWAARANHNGIVQLLIERGAVVDVTDNKQQTPLRCAVENGADQVCRSLLAAGANPNSRDIDGKTPLYSAVARNRIVAARLLLEGGADPDSGDRHGHSPRYLISAKAKPEWSELLAELDGDVDGR